MAVDRRHFLHLSSWGVLAGIFYTQNISAHTFILRLPKPEDTSSLPEAIEKARRAHKALYEKDFLTAETLYRECITLLPDDIRFYDGLRKVYASQKGKHLFIMDLYQKGLELNPKVASFYARLAKEYERLELGHKKLAREFESTNGINQLLEDAQVLYEKAIELAPDIPDYVAGKEKIIRRLTTRQHLVDARENPALKALRKEQRKKQKQNFKQLEEKELQHYLQELNTKSRRHLQSTQQQKVREAHMVEQKKRYLNRLCRLSVKQKQWNKAITYAETLYELDSSDRQSYYKLKRLYRKNDKWNKLVQIARDRQETIPTVWTYLGLMKALKQRYRKKKAGNLQEAIQLGQHVLEWEGLSVSMVNRVRYQMVSLYGLSDQNAKAHDQLESALESIQENTHPQIINDLLLAYALYYSRKNKWDKAEKVVKIGLNTSIEVSGELKSLQELAQQKEAEEVKHRRDLEVMLAKIYLQSNNSQATAQLEHIVSLYPNDRFALKKLNRQAL